MEKLITAIQSIHPLEEEELRRLLAAGEEKVLSRGECVIRKGVVDSSIYLIKSGVMRSYITAGDRDITLWFALSGETFFSSWGYVEGRPAQLNIEASRESTVLRYTKNDFSRLLASSPALTTWGSRLIEQTLLITEQWMVDFSHPLARERYLAFAEKMPELMQEIPLKDIAAYLRMTPQSLSRIRAELVKPTKGER